MSSLPRVTGGEGSPHPEEKVARECGLRLVEISVIYERAVVPDAAGTEALATVGLVARQRRLLHAAYLLADAGMSLEATYMVRAMAEFLIRQRWLELDPRRNQVLWTRDDLKARLRIDREIRELLPAGHAEAVELMGAEVRAAYEAEMAKMGQQLDEAAAELGEPGTARRKQTAYPTLREQAHATGLDVFYSLAYRSDSLLAHPTVYAIEQLFEAHPPDGVRVVADPPAGRGYADTYGVAAFILRDALASAGAQLPELALSALDEVAARLDEVARRPGANDDTDP